MELVLRGKSALICGASSGLGYAVAEALAREGCRVAINGRDAKKLEAAATKLRAQGGGEIIAIPGDVSIAEDATHTTQHATRSFGTLDIVLANAGGPPPGPFLSHDHATWVRAIETNLLSAVSLFRAALRTACCRTKRLDGCC